MDITNKVAVITGGASGLGRATTELFAEKGAKVAIFDMNQEAGSALADALGDNVIYQNVNVTDEASVQAALDATVEQFGAVHICCNFAGTGNAIKTFGRKGTFPLAEFNKIIQINLVGTFNVLRLAAEKMSLNEPFNEDGGRGCIINTASVAAYEGQMGQAAYSASKGGVVSMTLPIARDLAGIGVRVNTIVPGLFRTPLLESGGPDLVAALGAQVEYPKRLGEPREIAHIAQTLVENDYINGECIRLDGAIRMQAK